MPSANMENTAEWSATGLEIQGIFGWAFDSSILRQGYVGVSMDNCPHRLYHAIGVSCGCISPAAAIVAFVSWLSTRKVRISFGSMEECTAATDVIKRFCASQGWSWDEVTDVIQKMAPFPED